MRITWQVNINLSCRWIINPEEKAHSWSDKSSVGGFQRASSVFAKRGYSSAVVFKKPVASLNGQKLTVLHLETKLM